MPTRGFACALGRSRACLACGADVDPRRWRLAHGFLCEACFEVREPPRTRGATRDNRELRGDSDDSPWRENAVRALEE